ncbi:TonB family protein [Luteibaculum oceani]|uniref:TonB family protein n=1 Tax=Luteibaculum oceani TaxID=1294296 RepID=A0A5C6VKG0_9FLAO|nr:TonB family protein [Luteibaculum oceani]TXC85171.1 TonB family protein [Luteibaculum oceani]
MKFKFPLFTHRLLFTLLICILTGSSIKAQDTVVSFFRDLKMEYKVSEKRGRIKVLQINDGNTKTTQIYNVKLQCLVYQEQHSNGIPTGKWVNNTENCEKINAWDFSKLVYETISLGDSLFSNLEPESKYENYEKAFFGKDSTGIFHYIARNLRYPNQARNLGVSGEVYVQFIIKASGKAQMASIIQGAHPFLDLECWNLIENMPNWTPAKKDGIPVDSYSVVSMNFDLR